MHLFADLLNPPVQAMVRPVPAPVATVTNANTPKRTSHHVLERALFTNRPSLNFKPWHNWRMSAGPQCSASASWQTAA